MSYDDYQQQPSGDYGGRLSGYVDVPTRIAEFRAKYPEGSLQPADRAVPYRIETVTAQTNLGTKAQPDWRQLQHVYIVYVAAAYRSPDDQCPGIGMAWEPFPGRTPYTRDSELQNAETSAWGRAIVAALAADMHTGIATFEEIRNRRESDGESQQPPPSNPVGEARQRVAQLAQSKEIGLDVISNSFREDQGVEIAQASLEQVEAYYAKLEAGEVPQ